MNPTRTTAGDGSSVRCADGTRLHLRRLRAGHGTPVLFVHALAMDASLWADVAQAMRSPAALYAMDCRGHGLSDKPQGPYSTAQFAQDIASVLDHLGSESVHLVGCSMGGTVALAFAGRFAHRLVSLTVIDGTACYGEDVAAEWEARGLRPAREGFDAMLKFQLSRWFSEPFARSGAPSIERATEVFLRNAPHAYLEACRMLGAADERSALPRYRGPALVLVGEEDYATPVAMAQEMAALMPQARLKVLPGLRHFTPIESPATVAREIDALLCQPAPGLAGAAATQQKTP